MKQLSICFMLTLLLLGATACSKGEQNSATESNRAEQQPEEETVELKTVMDNVRLRDIAGLKGKEIARLSVGESLVYLNEMSDFTEKIKLRGTQYDDPWLKVQTETGVIGWIYAGAVRFDAAKRSKFNQQILTKRLEGVFGKAYLSPIEAYQDAFAAAKTETDFVALYRKAKILQDSLNSVLMENIAFSDRLTSEGGNQETEDLFWIEAPLPAFELAVVAEATMYHLFLSTKVFSKKAKATEGRLDDDFMKIVASMYEDDIENSSPVWFLQTSDEGGYSLLGQQKHLTILNSLESFAQKTDIFKPEVQKIARIMLDDITNNEDYSEKKEVILKELDAIINKNYSVFTNDEKILLKNRRAMFENPEKHGIKVYMRNE